MMQVLPGSIPYEVCPSSPSLGAAHCYHGVFFGGPITNKGRCCWCGKEMDLPWSMNPEKMHGQYHCVRAVDRAVARGLLDKLSMAMGNPALDFSHTSIEEALIDEAVRRLAPQPTAQQVTP